MRPPPRSPWSRRMSPSIRDDRDSRDRIDNRAIFVLFAAKMGAEERNLVVIDGEAEGLIYYILYLGKMAITAFCGKRMQNVGLSS